MIAPSTWEVRAPNGTPLYRPEPKQQLLHDSTAPNVLYGGAAGGMKSHGLRWHGIIACMALPGAQVLLLRREFRELRKTHLLKIFIEIPEDMAHWRADDQVLEFTNGSMLHFGHCKTDSDFRKHLSEEWDMILVDESGELTIYMLQLLPSRLRTVKHGIRPQYVLASNPGGEGHEYNFRYFVSRDMTLDEDPEYDPDKYYFIYADWNDNPHIDREEYAGRINALPEYERRRFSGDWSVAPDRFFPTWSTAHHVYDEAASEDELYKPHWFWFRSLDWGYAAPTSVGWWLVDDDGNLSRVRELYVAELDPEEHVPLIFEIDKELEEVRIDHANALGIRWHGPIDKAGYTVADPACWDMAPRWVKGPGPPIAERYIDAGLKDLVPASNQRKPGWQRLREYMNPKTMPTIRSERRCVNFNKQMSLLRRDPFDEEDIDRHGSKRQADHAADEGRYAVMSRPKVRMKPTVRYELEHKPGTASYEEAKYMTKVVDRRRKGLTILHPTLGPIKIR